jgi:hypothetical protein
VTIIPSEIEFGPGRIEDALSGQDIEFVPFIERIGDQPQSLSELLGSPETEHPLSALARLELERVLRYLSLGRTQLPPPILVELARQPEQSIGSLAAVTRRDVPEVELSLRALQELGVVVESTEQGVLRYSLRPDLRAVSET